MELITPTAKVATVNVRGYTDFVPGYKFCRGVTDGVKVVLISASFFDNFIGPGKPPVEQPVEAMTLRIERVITRVIDEQMIKTFGDSAEVRLSQLWELMKAQGMGEKGPLLVNGLGNIAYVRNLLGEMCAVNCAWSGGGWHLYARTIPNMNYWGVGDQILAPS